MTLSIVILSFNTPDLIKDCISSLRKQFEQELKNDTIEIVVVDNGSKEGVVGDVERSVKNLKNIKLIKSKENLGFGRGCNLGVENSRGEFVLFLNSDTKVDDKGFIKMTNFLKDNPKVGILGGRLMNFDGTNQASAGKFYNLFNFFIMMFGGEKFGFLKKSPSKISSVDWVSGACFMVNKDIFNKIGGFDKNIFMYMEDMELCYRAKKNGFATYYYPDVLVLHKEQGSSNRGFAIVNIYKGILYFYVKHKSKLSYQIVRNVLYIKAKTVYLLGKITNNSYYTSAYGQALELFK
jgi:GT2 family glycosyltransferase